VKEGGRRAAPHNITGKIMKLNEVRSHYETSGDMEEQFFSIKDQGMIFDILRNKMYSNPILAICREISCNARDAHREVGTSEVPIHIHLPNNLEQYYKIKDFGPGISPERMYDVFIQYTASTKRNDNIQTGGFGLGAKTPFSYSDSFSIVTNHDGIKYNYGCAIDETRVGKLALLSQSPTDDPNGTEIIIPVKPNDFRSFAEWTEVSTRHWDVKPVIKGHYGQFVWQEVKKTLEGKNWAISASSDWQRSAKIVIDGIEYPLELDALRKYADPKLIDAARGNLILYFGIGELTLSASREQVQLDKPTQVKIRQRLEEIVQEIKSIVDAKIDSFANLWDANVYYRKELTQAFGNLNFLGKLEWKGIPLQNQSYAHAECPTFKFTKGKYSRKYGTDPNKLTRSSGTEITFEENTVLYVNDLPLKEPTPRHVKKAFEDDPKLVAVVVVCPTDKMTLDTLNKNLHLDKMEPKKLSSITKASARAYTPATSRLLVFKFDANAGAFRQVSYSSLDEDTNKKVLCTLTRESYPNSRQVVLKSKKNLSLSSMKTLTEKFTGFSFYGLDDSAPADRVEEDFSDFEDIEEFIDEKVLSNKTINYVEIKFATTHNYHVDEKMLRNYSKIKPLITEPGSFFLKRLELHKKIKTMCEGDLGLLFIYESVHGEINSKEIEQFVKDNPEYDLESANKDYEQKYPLLGHVNVYNYSQVVPHVAQYVNLIDKV
jgi:hypothetical protein